MSTRSLAKGLVGLASVIGARSAMADFVSPTTADPINNYTAAIGVDYSQVQSFTETLKYDSSFNSYPDVYWFKYTSDGKTAVTFDTLGSNFGSNGPSGGSGGSGSVLGTTNASEIAVFNSAGKSVAISKNVVDSSGNPVEIARFLNEPQPPTLVNNQLPKDYYYSEDLSQLSFKANATSNPRWSVSPNDPNGYVSWVAPDNQTYGNTTGQSYAPLNEYKAWAGALTPYKLNSDGTYNMAGGQLHNQPGYMYYNYGTLGPASTWNQYRVLPAGTYYVAVSAEGIVFSGDTYSVDLLQAPIHYDYTGNEPNNGKLPEITQPLGAFQYYDDPTGYQNYGNIVLNVTQAPATVQYQWLTDADSSWSNPANWAGSIPGSIGDTANFLSTNTAARTVTLTAPQTVGHLVFDSAFQYTLAGNSALTINNGAMPGDVILNSGSHVISAPLNIAGNATIIAYAGNGLSITGTLGIAAGVTLTKDGAGSLLISGAQTNATGSALYIGEGTATITSDPGSNLALTSTAAVTFPAGTSTGIRPIHLASLSLSLSGLVNGSVTFATAANRANRTVLVTSSINITGTSSTGWVGQLDLGGNDAVVHAGNLAQLTNQIKSGYNLSSGGHWNGQGITSSAAANDATRLTALGIIGNSSSSTFDNQAIVPSDVLIKYTYFGDSNLDGRVDGSDYTLIDNGFNTRLTGWQNGDFNYDGVIDGSDYTLIDNAFLSQGAAYTAVLAVPTNQIASPTSSAVPEPCSGLLLSSVALSLLSRRRNR